MAEGCELNGKPQSDYTIRTSSRPYAILATADNEQLEGEGRVAHITIQVVDENGVVVKLADNDIRCTVQGPGRLLGLEGSNNTDMTDYTDNHQRVYNGRLLAYVKSTGKGDIVVRLSSPLLKGCEIRLSCK